MSNLEMNGATALQPSAEGQAAGNNAGDQYRESSLPPDLIADLAEIGVHQKAIDGILQKWLRNLPPTELRRLNRVGEKSFKFVKKSVELARTNPHFLPGYKNSDEFGYSLEAVQYIMGLIINEQQNLQNLKNLDAVKGDDASKCASAFYANSKKAAEQGVPGAKAVYEALKMRYPRQGKAKTAVESSAEAPPEEES
jgi:hypothetical protein